MNVIRTLPLLVLALALTACAAKPARDSAPASVDVAPSVVGADRTMAATDPVPTDSAAPADGAVATSSASPEDAAAPPATSNGADPTPTNAEDDFAALYGGPAPTADGTAATSPSYDPWEPLNRRVHGFNVVVDRVIARPLATAYTNVVPRFARTGVSNFFSNLRAPVTITNQLLQGRPDDAWDSLGRFLMNSTLGLGGLFDPATKAMVPRRKEDFGQTLGTWGWRQSRYVELPFFGPRTVRDVFGMAGDAPLSPLRTIEADRARIGLQGLQLVDTRSQLLAVDDMLNNAVDQYTLVRDAWLQRRNYQIENDLRSKRDRGNDDPNAPIPVDAMPMPDWGN